MARSTNVYMLARRDNLDLRFVTCFTVLHECKTWAEKHISSQVWHEWQVWRSPDNGLHANTKVIGTLEELLNDH